MPFFLIIDKLFIVVLSNQLKKQSCATENQNQLRKFFTLSVFCLLFLCLQVSAQDGDVSTYKQQYQLHILKTNDKVKIDGELNEEVWKTAEAAKNFWLKFPKDDAKAVSRTEVKLAYDNNFIYHAAGNALM